jgi:hypothetical protein
VNTAPPGIEVGWWRERNQEVDFVVSDGRRTTAIEVASGRRKASVPGLRRFVQAFPEAKPLLIGGQGMALEEALSVGTADLLEGPLER